MILAVFVYQTPGDFLSSSTVDLFPLGLADPFEICDLIISGVTVYRGARSRRD
jgi:hypothetical protein